MRCAALLPASLLTVALAVAFVSRASADILVNIDKSTQSMTVTVDGTPRYIWPVSTGRPGYDTPNGTFRPNRMDATHLSQEWDNAPMPHTIFFDMRGHAIHGFFNTSNIGNPASHGCVRLAPENAAALYGLVEAEGLKETTVIISGRAPARMNPEVARRRAPAEVAAQPLQIGPGNGAQPAAYRQPPAAYGAQAAANAPQPRVNEAQQPPAPDGQDANRQDAYRQNGGLFGALFGQRPANYGQQQPYYQPQQQPYYVQQLPSGQRLYFYAQPSNQQPYARPYTQ
jgi:hypothetical protein